MSADPGEIPGGPSQERSEEHGEVFDLGYQRYEGQREGRRRARYAMWRDGSRITLGLGRSVTKKVAPFGLIGLMWLPALVVIIVSGFITTFGGALDDADGPTFAEYFRWSIVFVAIFSAVTGPELICPDRRQGVVTLYLVRPISVIDYLGMRWLALASVLVAVLWFPQALIFAWNTMSAPDALEWAREHADALPRSLAAAAAISVLMTSVAMASSSFTSRRPYAAVGALAIILVGEAIAAFMDGTFSGAAAQWSALVNLRGTAIAVSDWIMGEPAPGGDSLAVGWFAGWHLVVTGAGMVAMWLPYRKGLR